MEYLTTKETAKKWGVNVSLVRRYCTQEHIPGVIQRDGAWLIPEDAKRPMKIEPGVKEPVVLPALAQKLLRQKKKKSFDAQIQLQNLSEHRHNFLSAGVMED